MNRTNFIIFASYISISLLLFNCSGGVATTTADNNKLEVRNYPVEIADSIAALTFNSDAIKNFRPKRKPRFVVGRFDDFSKMNIDTDLLQKNIERNLLDSGEVTFITSKAKREVSRTDRKNYSDFKNKRELKKYLKPLRADFFISGVITGETDSLSNIIMKKIDVKFNLIDTRKMKLISEKKFQLNN